MGKVVVTEFVTLDGVFEDPGGSEGTPNGGWQIPLMGDDESSFKLEELKQADALLLGRTTYEGFAAAWPSMPDSGEFGERMNGLPKYVATMSLSEFNWNNSRQLGTDLVTNVQQLKKDYKGDILVYGSGRLARALLSEGLIDELRLMTYPIILGTGKRLLADTERAELTLLDSQVFPNGTVLLNYGPKKAN
jgi:dihydrofolate reductase